MTAEIRRRYENPSQALSRLDRKIRELESRFGRLAGIGVTDHGALSGLGDDDHTQYHNDARGDARYSQLGHTHSSLDPITADLDPSSDNARDLGNATNSWRNLYAHAIYDEGGTARWDLNSWIAPAGDIRLGGDQLFFNYGTETNSYLQHSTGSNYFRYVQAGSEGFRFFHNGTTSRLDLYGTSNSHLRKVEGTILYIDNEVADQDIVLRTDDGAGIKTRILIDGAGPTTTFYNDHGTRLFQINEGGNGSRLYGSESNDWMEIDGVNEWFQFFLNDVERIRFQTDRLTFYDELYGTTSMTGTGSTGNEPIRHNTTTIQFYRWTSERKFKENIRTLEEGLGLEWSEGIYDLEERVFDMIEENRQGQSWNDFDIPGYIADEFYDVFGARGTGMNPEGEPAAWSATLLTIAHNVELKKARSRIHDLEARVKALEAA